jgi:hypothetical protein
MSFGLQTWGTNGALQLSTDNFTYQVIHNALYTASASTITVNISGYSPSTCSAVLLPVNPAPNEYIYSAMPFMIVGAGYVQILGKHPNETDASLRSTIQVRLLVTRYKN